MSRRWQKKTTKQTKTHNFGKNTKLFKHHFLSQVHFFQTSWTPIWQTIGANNYFIGLCCSSLLNRGVGNHNYVVWVWRLDCRNQCCIFCIPNRSRMLPVCCPSSCRFEPQQSWKPHGTITSSYLFIASRSWYPLMETKFSLSTVSTCWALCRSSAVRYCSPLSLSCSLCSCSILCWCRDVPNTVPCSLLLGREGGKEGRKEAACIVGDLSQLL